MHILERKIWSGAVLEIQRYLTEKVRNLSQNSRPNPRFKTEEERAEFMLARSRRHFERLVNENFTPAGTYDTFTFNQDYECHTAAEAKYLLRLYIRRIRRDYPSAKIIAVIGKGKKTSRYHVHALIEGVPKDIIESKWTYGEVCRIEQLREHNYYDGVDHGRDYTAVADYMFDHWTPEQGQRKWIATKNLCRPEVEVTTEPAGIAAKKGYDAGIPEIPAGYIFIEAKQTKYGFSSFKYVLDPKPKRQRIPKDKEGRKSRRKKTGG